jgi:hypothetical protein
MNGSYYPQEYLDSAYDQGYQDFWDGVSDPDNTLPQREKDEWYKGWNAAHSEQMGRTLH